MSEPLSDILPAFFVKLKSLSQGWERAIRPRPLPPPPFPRVITSYRRSKSRWSTLFTSSAFRPMRDRVNDVSKSPIRRRISTETGNRTQLGDFFFFWKISGPDRRVSKGDEGVAFFSRRECEMAREPFSWEVGFSRARVERIDECFRWEAGGYQAFGSRESFFFFFLKRGFIFLDLGFRPGVW